MPAISSQAWGSDHPTTIRPVGCRSIRTSGSGISRCCSSTTDGIESRSNVHREEFLLTQEASEVTGSIATLCQFDQ